MPLLTLYIDTSANQLLTSLNNPTVLNTLDVPLFAGDSGLILQVYLLTPLQTTNPSQFNYEILSTAGLALEAYLDNGELGADNVIYTQQVAFSTDPNNQYFYGSFPLNTAGILGLFTTNTSATATLHIGYLQGGNTTTVLYDGVTLLPGISSQLGPLPAGLTALSQQGGDQRYVPLVGIAGQSRTMVSPNGKILMERAVDNGDGTATVQWDAVN